MSKNECKCEIVSVHVRVITCCFTLVLNISIFILKKLLLYFSHVCLMILCWKAIMKTYLQLNKRHFCVKSECESASKSDFKGGRERERVCVGLCLCIICTFMNVEFFKNSVIKLCWWVGGWLSFYDMQPIEQYCKKRKAL